MGNQPTYEESLAKIASLESKLNVLIAGKKATDDNDDDDKMEASFKKAQSEMKNEEKEKSAETDDMNKVKDAFKKAQDETDPEKKKEAVKKALEMKDDYESKKAKKAEDEPNPKTEKKDLEAHAKIANLEKAQKLPLMNKILEATSIIDPSNLEKVKKELTAASLEEVEAKFATIQPYIAAVGLENKSVSAPGMTTMIPFQASTVTDIDSTNILEASVDSIDFSKVKTSDIMGLYN